VFADPAAGRELAQHRFLETARGGRRDVLDAGLPFADSVDVLVIDEAGQVSLGNVLAVSRAAANIVLVGDRASPTGVPTACPTSTRLLLPRNPRNIRFAWSSRKTNRLLRKGDGE
jgi:hypothetical protein